MNRDATMQEKPYGMTMEQRRRAVITGVTQLESFDEDAVVLKTHGGRLTLSGSGLHVSSLQLEEGRLHVDGCIDSAVYEGSRGGRRGGFFRRIPG